MMHFNRISPVIWALFLSFVTFAAAAQGNGTNAHGHVFGKGHPQTINDLPPGQLKSDLEGLSPKARGKALGWLQRFSFPAEDVDSLRVDSEGSVLYADAAPPPSEALSLTQLTTASPAIDLQNLFKLHSRPGSSNVVFLDFDGHTLQNTAWNADLGQNTLVALPFDPSLNDNPKTVANFTQEEMNRIAEIWHRVAEDFSTFDIDVTTEEPNVFTNTTGHILITHDSDAAGRDMPRYNSSGTAHVDVFGLSNYATYYSPVLVYYTNLYTFAQGFPTLVSEVSSHEFGHNLGLGHDGIEGTYYYYQGHGNGLVNWGPIMGSSIQKNVTQWSQGEYPGANNTEDDLAIIGEKLGYIGDDHANSSSQATALAVDADGAILVSSPELDPDNILTENKGIIGDRDDVDWFYVDVTGSGTLEITATPSWHSFTRNDERGSNLDIELSLFNSNQTLIAVDEPQDDTNATVTATVNPGRYYLQLDGVGNNTYSDYSDYSSIGMYFIEGSIPTGSTPPDTTPPSPAQMSWQSPPAAIGTSAISMTAVTATDDSGSVEYSFTCVAGGTGCSSSGWQASSTYTDGGLAANTSYSYKVTARDAAGNMNTASATASATTEAAPDTTPPSPAQMSWQSPPAATGTSAISMTAVTATDDSGSVEYSFTCVAGGTGCSSSGWQGSSTYTDGGLAANTSYSYKVTARDAAGNMNNASATASATTEAAPDTTPPSPAQMSWQSPPAAIGTSAISMTAVTATDDSGSVEYSFTCVAGGTGCSSSGWQASSTYTDGGLAANTSYSYKVTARDAAGNMNTASATASATTDSTTTEDTTPPSPDRMTWQTPPHATGSSAISMTAVTATDDSGSVEYYFSCISGGTGCSSSGWQTSSTYINSGLQADTRYSYKVTARDAAGNMNNISFRAWATTDVEGTPTDTTPPSPSQMSWQTAPYATGTSSISMTAVTATDASGSVEYSFTCVSGGAGCSSSGWQTSKTYTDGGLQANSTYSYTVQAKDAAGNMNNVSASASATTGEVADTTPPSPSQMSWQTAPYATGTSSISMTAITATDASGSVEYSFTCVSGGAGCSSSGWQTSKTYTDGGLQANTSYSYTVRARDAAGNMNNGSAAANATTDAVEPPPTNLSPTAVASYSPNPAIITKGTWFDVTLNGTASYDPDGSITSWSWKDQSGTIVSTAPTYSERFREGDYSYTLTVTDNKGASSTTPLVVTVIKNGKGKQ